MSLTWQHPFVDLFRSFGTFEFAETISNGVQVTQDNDIARKVIKLYNSTPSNAAITIPSDTTLKSLGLIGKYIYIEFQPQKVFKTTLEFQIANTDMPVKFTISNLYDGFNVQSNNLLIPFPKNSNKWTILIIDVPFFLANYGLLSHSLYKSFNGIHVLKKVVINGNQNIRGIFTSDNFYDWSTMPKQMLFKLPKGKQYHEEYQIAFWPTQQITPQLNKGPLNEATNMLMETIKECEKKIDTKVPQPEVIDSKKQVNDEDLVQTREPTKKLQNEKQGTDNQILSPYPIMALNRAIGFSVQSCPDIRFGKNLETLNKVFYASGSNIVENNIENGEQHFLFCGQYAIASLDVSKDGKWLAIAQNTNSHAIVRIFDIALRSQITAFSTPFYNIVLTVFSGSKQMLAVVGNEDQIKESIYLFNLLEIETTKKPVLFAKQAITQSLLCLKFSPIEIDKLVSCGHENIRFWRVKSNFLKSSSVVLNSFARNNTFLVTDFEFGYTKPTAQQQDSQLLRVFVASKLGQLYSINYHTQELLNIYKLHDNAIVSLCVSAGFCVTGSKDSFLRVWPLDFSEFYIEAKHEGAVTSLDVSVDGLKVFCGTSSGGLGTLDIQNHNYKTLIRSHTDVIKQLVLHLHGQMLMSLSNDQTIRLWSLSTHEQMYEFSFPADDQCNVISAHPSQLEFVGGFNSGTIRVFDIQNTSILQEIHTHDCPVVSLNYSHDGKRLVAGDKKSNYKLYDTLSQYQAIFNFPVELQSEFQASAFSIDDQVIAVVGDKGNHVNLYESISLQFLVKIFVQNSNIRFINFSNNNLELIIGCNTSQKIRVYGLKREQNSIKAYFLREQTQMHKQELHGFENSQNLVFLFSIGADPIIRVWDFDYLLRGPGSNQTIFGHLNNINSIVYHQGLVYTAGGSEGIYEWKFGGNLELSRKQLFIENGIPVESARNVKKNDPIHKTMDQMQKEMINQLQQNQYDDQEEQQQEDHDSYEEKDDGQDRVQQLMQEFLNGEDNCPTFNNLGRQFMQQDPKQLRFQSYILETEQGKKVELDLVKKKRKQSIIELREMSSVLIERWRQDLKIPFSHISLNLDKQESEQLNNQIELELGNIQINKESLKQKSILLSSSCNTNNFIWNIRYGYYAYTHMNLLVVEYLTPIRLQKVVTFPSVVGVIALSVNNQYMAIGTKLQKNQEANIYVLNGQDLQIVKTLVHHTRPIQVLQFSGCDSYLISCSNFRECTVAIWQCNNFNLIASSYTVEFTNDVKINNYCFNSEFKLEFTTVGRDCVYFWGLNQQNKLEFFDLYIKGNMLTTIEFVDFIENANTQNPQNSQNYKTQTQQLIKTTKGQLVNQSILVGNDKGQLIYLQYGQNDVKNIQQVCKQEIIKISYDKNTKCLIVMSLDGIYYSTIKDIMNIQFKSMQFNSSPIGFYPDLSYSEALVNLFNGQIQLVNFSKQIQFGLNSTCSSPEFEIQYKSFNQSLVLGPIGQIIQCGKNIMALTHINGVLRIFTLDSNEEIAKYTFSKQISTFYYDDSLDKIILFLNDNSGRMIGLKSLKTIEEFQLTTAFDNELIEVIKINQTKLVFSKYGEVFQIFYYFKNNNMCITLQQIFKIEGFQHVYQSLHHIFWVAQNTISTVQITNESSMQLTVIDQVNFLKDPHGVELQQEDKTQTTLLYEQLNEVVQRVNFCWSQHQEQCYFATVGMLQYIFVRNFFNKETILRLGMTIDPLSICCIYEKKQVKLVVGGHSQIEIIDPSEQEISRTQTLISLQNVNELKFLDQVLVVSMGTTIGWFGIE